MSLNLKLQSSATKNQARAIELELRRIEAKEAKELLSIIQVRLHWGRVRQDLLIAAIALPPAALRRVRHRCHQLLPPVPTPRSEV